MKLYINPEVIKLLKTPQGHYLKTLPPYRYRIFKLDFDYCKFLNDTLLDIEDKYFKKNKLYKFDSDYLTNGEKNEGWKKCPI